MSQRIIIPLLALTSLNYFCCSGVKGVQDMQDDFSQLKISLRRAKRATCGSYDCKNGGRCVTFTVYNIAGVPITVTQCLCLQPYSSVDCSALINYCDNEQPDKNIYFPICLNGGTCAPFKLTAPYFTCSCLAGFDGTRCENNINDCWPCVNGQCTDLVNNYICNCYRGWEGRNCDVNHNDCFTGACLNGGRCFDGNGTYTCDCSNTGFTGSICEINIDDCASKPCVNGQCTDLVNAYSCSCYTGWEGKNCSVNTNYCLPVPCLNGGRCIDGNSTFTCDCSAIDYTGVTCSSKINDCQPNPCLNGGICTDGLRNYTCNCNGTGFHGTNCSLNVDDCSPNPCMNDATCIDLVNNYTCSCHAAYIGRNCSTDIVDCTSNRCENGGICYERSNPSLYKNPSLPSPFNGSFSYSQAAGFLCVCQTGYIGSTCFINPNDCLIPGTNQSICLHASSCTDGLNTYTCNCYSGWEGRNCSVNHDDCAAGACANGGKCIDGNGTFTCDCSTVDYQGPNYSTRINDCQPNPCLNGATCTDDMRSYNCTCLPGYSGRNCSVDFPDCSPNPCESSGVCFERSNPVLYSLATMPWPFNGPFNATQAVGYICLYPGSNEMSSATVAGIAAAIPSLLLSLLFLIVLSQIGKGKISLGIFEKRPSKLNESQKGFLPSSSVSNNGSPYLIPDRNAAAAGNESMYDTPSKLEIQNNDLLEHYDQYATATGATDLDSQYTKADTLVTSNKENGFSPLIHLAHINPIVPPTACTVNASAGSEHCVDNIYDEAGQNVT